MGAPKPSPTPSPSHDFERVDKEVLGTSTWTFLHTLAATYPSAPASEESARVSRFMRDFAALYPCAPCARSFRAIVARRPPDDAARRGGAAFAQWMCRVHNDVNEELGKDPFDCSEAALAARWGECESCAAHKDDLDSFMKMGKIPGMPK